MAVRLGERVARGLIRRRVALPLIVAWIAVAGVGAAFSTRVQNDDDLLAFLPVGNPEVETFRAIGETFGSLEVGLVGIDGVDVLDPSFFGGLQRITRALNERGEVAYALSLANLEDFEPSPQGGIETDYLVRSIPVEADDRAQLRAKVLGNGFAAGRLVARDLRAATIFCFANAGVDPKTFAAAVRDVVEREGWTGPNVHFGGAPFVSSYIYDVTERELSRLTPWAVLVIILATLLSFRDPVGAGLALLATGMGIAVTLGLMGIFGVHTNIVLSSMPIILFSLGSGYAIHLIARYYALARLHPRQEALVLAYRDIARPLLGAGLTTVVGLGSFVVMDVAPLRTFGLFTALGLLTALLVSLTFVPAVLSLIGRTPTLSDAPEARLSRASVAALRALGRRRWAVGLGLAAFAVACLYFAVRVDNRMDQSAFFASTSPPARADRFFLDRFGGSAFLQIRVAGDLQSPEVLRELGTLADRIALVPHVAGVEHVGEVVARINEAMEGERRIPDSPEKVQLLYTFLDGNRALTQLVTRDRREGLIVVKLGTSDLDETEATLAAVERLVGGELIRRFRAVPALTDGRPHPRLLDQVVDRIRALAHAAQIEVDATALRRDLARPATRPSAAEIAPRLASYLGSDEFVVELAPDARDRLAARLAALHAPDDAARVRAEVEAELGAADAVLVEDVVAAVGTPVVEAHRRAAAESRARSLGTTLGWPAERLPELTHAVSSLSADEVLVPADADEATGSLQAAVSGLPVLHRGLSVSAGRNQLRSMGLALALVILLLAATFRSVGLGLLASAPTALTLAVAYGGMGVLGIHLDLGTSMLASLIIGAGVDFAVHLVEAHRRTGLVSRAVADTAPAIWTNALMVASGFAVLTLGEAKTLQNVSALTAFSLVVAALATFVLIPLLLPWPAGVPERTSPEAEPSNDPVVNP